MVLIVAAMLSCCGPSQPGAKPPSRILPPPNTASDPTSNDRTPKETLVSMQDLEKKVLAKDPAAVDLAKSVGASATPRLIELASNADAGVRRIAVNCIRRTGGPAAPGAFLNAAKDENSQVRGSAMAGLKACPDPLPFMPLLEIFNSMEDPDQRCEMCFILTDNSIGDVQAKQTVSGLLKTKIPLEKESPELRDAMLASLAKLGDEDARKAFALSLSASENEQEWLRKVEACDWISQDWLPKAMLPMLAVKDEVERIGVDARPDLPHYLRVCDKAAQTICRIAKPKLAFDPATKINLKDAELGEIREAIRKMP